MATSSNSAGSGFTDNDTGWGTYLGGDPTEQSNYSNYSTTTNTATDTAPVTTATTTPGIGASRGTYDQGVINAALRTELAARPGTTYADMVRYATDPYGVFGAKDEQGNAYSKISPTEVLNAYDALQGSITPYNQPTPGQLYSAAPAIYQPVRYTPQYDTYGQGIASLFGPGYSQYFQPPGATGVNYFGTPGGGTSGMGGGTSGMGGGTGGVGGTNQPPPTIIRPPVIPEGLTEAQAQRWLGLSPADREQYIGFAGAYNDPGNVQSDAQLLQDYMTQNNLSAADVARITGIDVGAVNSYLGQAGLTDPQLGRYVVLGSGDQSSFADLAAAYNDPGDTASDAAKALAVMQENKLSAADVARITGIPIAEVNAYLALAQQPVYEETAMTTPSNLTSAQQAYYESIAEPVQRDVYADLATAYNGPGDTASDASAMLGVMQQNSLSAQDVSNITGIPLADVNAYLALAK